MPRKRNNPVLLTAEDRDTLEDLIASGHAPARQLTHARILLKADDGADKPAWPDTKIADALEVSRSTVSIGTEPPSDSVPESLTLRSIL